MKAMTSVTQKKVCNITFGYSDSEDRLWLRLILAEGGEAILWLTRRLCLALCSAIANQIEKYTVINNIPLQGDALRQHLKKEFFETKTSTWAPSPAPQKQEEKINNPPSGVCHTAFIDTDGKVWVLRLAGPNNVEYALPMEREKILKILFALTRQANQNEWGLNREYRWMNI